MKSTYSLILSVVLVTTQVSIPAFASESMSVAVSRGEQHLAESEEVADGLREHLSALEQFHVIDAGLVDQVVGYYDDDSGIAAGFVEAGEYVSRAQEHYFLMQYEEADAEIERAVQLLEDDPASMDDKGQLLFDALMTQGMIRRAMKRGDDARNSFGRAASINPIAELNRKNYPPSVISIFDQQRSDLKKQGEGAIEVKTDPSVADVYINGIQCGVTPLRMNGLPAGTYAVMIRANKYQTVSKDVTVRAGSEERLSHNLHWLGASDRRALHRSEIDQALKIAELLKADKAVLITSTRQSDSSGTVRARVVDRSYRAGFRPIIASYDAENRAEVLDQFYREVSSTVARSIADDPAAYTDPDGTADPVLLGYSKKRFYRRPIFWGAVGTVVAGAIAGGVMAAVGGGSSPSDTGSVRVQFK